MTRKRRITMLGGSLAMAAVLAVGPATHSVAAPESEPTAAGPAVCTALVDELVAGATALTDGLTALPPDLGSVAELVNGLLKLATGLVDLGCLPAPELPLPEAAEATQAGTQQVPPLPPVPPLPTDPVLPTVPVCTDLTADLLHAITGVLAALVSTGLPDLTGALDALTSLLATLTGLTDEACLPATPMPT